MSMSDKQFMRIAEIVADNSTCSRLRVGALLVKDRRIISTGYNGAPAGMRHCYHQASDERPCEAAVHAEVNTIAFAAKHGVATMGAILFTTHSPCKACAMLIINAGIWKVTYEHDFRSDEGLALLEAGRVLLNRP